MTAALILSLPDELLFEILGYLEAKELLQCCQTCRTFHNIIKQSVESQYCIELWADGLVDGPRTSGSPSIAQRYALLLDRRRRWRQLNWTQQVTVPLPGPCQAYELVGGVFAKSMSVDGWPGSKHLISAWLPSRTEDMRSITRDDLGVPTRDFAIDPTQDLIALVDVDDSPAQTIQIKVHLRKISTNTPHPQASKSCLTAPIPFQLGSCFVQIVADVLGMFFWLHGPGLIVWNWRTGEMVVVRHPFGALGPLPVAYDDVAPNSQQHRTGFELPPGTWDFAFISPRAFIITVTEGPGSIEVYTFGERGKGLSNDPLNVPPYHVATLLLPELQLGQEVQHFTTHSAPFLGGQPTDGKAFVISQSERIHMLSFHYGDRSARYHLYMKNSYLLKLLPVTAPDKYEAKVYQWDEWGPDNTRFMEHRIQFQWLRYVHGQRIVFPPVHMSQPPCTPSLCVFDFNVHPKRIDDPYDALVDNETDYEWDYVLVDTPTLIKAQDLFQHDVVTRLPYAMSTRAGPWSYSGFMIDEERLIGMKSMAFAEGSLSDIDVFTF